MSYLCSKIGLSDWIHIGGSVLSAAIAVSIPYIINHINKKNERTNLKLNPENKFTYPVLKSWLGRPDLKVHYCYFSIKNCGNRIAHKCVVYLENIWLFDNKTNNFKSFSLFHPRVMQWSETKEPYLDIHPTRTVFCNIGHVESLESLQVPGRLENLSVSPILHIDELIKDRKLPFVFDAFGLVSGQPNFIPPGEYILQVCAFSENTDFQRMYLRIKWSGNWQNEESNMRNEIEIEETVLPKNNTNTT